MPGSTSKGVERWFRKGKTDNMVCIKGQGT